MSLILSGPQLRLVINGKTIGYVSDLNYNVTQGAKSIFTVDSPFPGELAQGAGPSQVSGSMTVFKLNGTSLEATGIVSPRSSPTGSVTEGVDYLQTSLGAGQYSTIELYDRQTETLTLKIRYVMFNSQSWSIASKQVVQGSVAFTGILIDHNPNILV